TGGSCRRRRREARGASSRRSTPARRTRSAPWLRNTWDGCLASCRLCCLCRLCRDHPDALLGLGCELELDIAGGRREERVIATEIGARAGEERHAALAHDDRPSLHGLAVTGLDAEPLANAVAPVLDGAAGLLVCHRSILALLLCLLRGRLRVGGPGARLGFGGRLRLVPRAGGIGLRRSTRGPGGGLGRLGLAARRLVGSLRVGGLGARLLGLRLVRGELRG